MKVKPARHKKRWTQEEIEYLQDNWGLLTINTLAKKLQRTEEAIQQKAMVLKLGKSQYANGLMYSPPQVAKLLKKDVKDIYKFIEQGLLKAKRKKLIDRKLYQIHFDDLMDFLKNNPDKWDSRKIPPYTFGIEPGWMQEKRKRDAKIPNHNKRWSKEEEEHLILLVKAGHPMKVIANILGRSLIAIYRRTEVLREQGRLKPTKIMLPWTDEEWNMVLEMEKQGLDDKEIAYRLGREKIHIADKRRALRKKGKYIGYKTDNQGGVKEMTSITYENSANSITLELAVKLYEMGVATIINDGKDVTFEVETLSTSEESTRRN